MKAQLLVRFGALNSSSSSSVLLQALCMLYEGAHPPSSLRSHKYAKLITRNKRAVVGGRRNLDTRSPLALAYVHDISRPSTP